MPEFGFARAKLFSLCPPAAAWQGGRVIAKSMGLILKALCGNGLGQFRFSVFFLWLGINHILRLQ